MDKKIVVLTHMFSLNQQVLIADEEGSQLISEAQINTLPELVLETCRSAKVYDVDMCGSVDFVQPIVDEIKNKAATEYASMPINIEIKETF